MRGEINSHTEEQHLQSAECWLKTQAVCKTFQPNEDTFNANVAIGSIPLNCVNNAIIRGLEFAPRSQNFVHVAPQQCTQSVRYPDSFYSVRPQIRVAQEDETKHVIVSESETIQPIANQNQLQLQGNKYAPASKSKISVLPQGVDMRFNSSPQREGGFANGRRETSSDSLVFPRPLWERARVRGVSKNNNKLLIIDWIVSLSLTMTKNFTNNAILRGLNDCSPQNDSKMTFTLAEGATHVALSNNSRKAAFTEPSRGMSGAKVEQTSAETLSFRCVCERCRLMRGEVHKTTRKVAFTLAEGATHVAHWKKSRNIAFTLAEVLITLGIIGVVAALTLPSVFTKFQQKTFTTAFKKEYSTLNNAINMIVFENDTKECYLTLEIPEGGGLIYSAKDSDCNALKTNLITKLRLTKVDKYVSSYLTKSKVLEQGGVSVNSSVTYDSILRNGEFNSYLIPDGGIVSFFYAQYGGLVADTSIVIDVNGKKGPNKWGYDVFWLTLVKTNDGLRLTDEYATLSEKGGSLPRNILLNSWSNNYNNIGHGLWQ